MKWIANTVPPNEVFEHSMRRAAAEARKWLGATSPNPPVGAVALDAHGQILAVAAHHRAGEAHAEALLLENCRRDNLLPRLETMVVTLEPCNHQGSTPPCAEAIIKAGVKRVVFGVRDPNQHVAGGGSERLKAAGVEVIPGIAENECQQLIHAFAYRAATGKPFVTVKRALREDGSMIPPAGQTTFTSPDSLRLAHQLRKKADAIITGSGTVLSDNPLFNVRHALDYPNKRRWLAILDRRGRVPQSYLDAAKTRHLDAIIYKDIKQALDDLTAKGAQDVLVEAGQGLSASLLDSDLWTMSVTIRQAASDEVAVGFHPDAPLLFDTRHFCWDAFLPQD